MLWSYQLRKQGSLPKILDIILIHNIWGHILISITHYNRNLVRKLSSFPHKSRDECSNEEEDVRVLGLPYL